MKLSIIIPVYNVEKYLVKCLDSILVDNMFAGQVVCVNDGSSDNSMAILEQYATNYPNIEIISQPNAGLSAARNAGIKAAKGEYICFMDSDDYWEPNVLGGLLTQIARDNLDVLRYNYQNVNEQYEVFLPYRDAKRDVDYSESVVDGATFLNERLGPMCYAVMFIVKRSMIYKSRATLDATHIEPKVLDPTDLDNPCLFKEGIYFEDTEWTPRMLLRAKRVASTGTVVYNYLWRSGSITLPDNPQKREKVLRDKVALIHGFKEQQRLVKDNSWFTWMTSFTAMTILGMLTTMPASQRNPYLKELKSLDIFPLSIKKERILSHKVKIMLANASPSLYCILMSLRI